MAVEVELGAVSSGRFQRLPGPWSHGMGWGVGLPAFSCAGTLSLGMRSYEAPRDFAVAVKGCQRGLLPEPAAQGEGERSGSPPFPLALTPKGRSLGRDCLSVVLGLSPGPSLNPGALGQALFPVASVSSSHP